MKKFVLMFKGDCPENSPSHVYTKEKLLLLFDLVASYIEKGDKGRLLRYLDQLEVGKRKTIELELSDGLVEITLSPEHNFNIN